MKKLMIVAAVALMGAVANAAQCSWNALGISKDSIGTDYTGYSLYLCDASVYAATTLAADIALGDYSKLSTAGFVQETAGSIRQGTTDYVKIDSTKSFGDYSVGASHEFYMLILNGDIGSATEFMTSYSKTGTVPSSGKLQMSFANVSTTAGSSDWTAIAVPEPTSGLLLLLGMAGIALKRKIA